MALDHAQLERLLCERLCAHVRVYRRHADMLMLESPFTFPDGDHYPIYLSETPGGGVKLSDRGHTLMHVSYEHYVDSFHARLMIPLASVSSEAASESDRAPNQNNGLLCLLTVVERVGQEALPRGARAVRHRRCGREQRVSLARLEAPIAAVRRRDASAHPRQPLPPGHQQVEQD